MPDLNPLPTKPATRWPRSAVRVASEIVPFVSWSVENNVFRAADTFTVALPISALPAARNLKWFAAQSEIDVEIFANEAPADPATYTPSTADRLIYATTDDVNVNLAQGVLELTGRDLTARLIDTKTSETFLNQTASQIATTIAGRHGLTPVVTATSGRVGAYYAQDHADLHQQRSEWEMLVRLAEFEDFDVFVIGKELHFQPKPKESGSHYVIEWTPPSKDAAHPTSNTTTLTLSRSLTIAKGVTVEVRSWNAKQKRAFTASWPKQVKPVKPGQANPNNQVYRFIIAGLTQDQATQRAKKLYDEIVQHMVKLDADLPGDRLLDCGTTIQLRGTGTGFDQVYFPESVQRSMSMADGEGFRMTVSAKNISQDVEAAQQQ